MTRELSNTLKIDRARDPHRKNKQFPALLVMFVLSFSLDFRGPEGGSAVQYAMATVNSIAFLSIAAKNDFGVPRRGFAAYLFWSWATFLLVGSAGAAVWNVAFSRYIRIIYPFVLFVEGFLVAWWVARRSHGGVELVRWMYLAALTSFVFTVWWGFDFSGRGIQSIRHQILSPTIPFLLVVAGYDLLFASRNRLRSLVVITAVLSVIALSVTRGMLLVVGMVVAGLLAANAFNFLRGEFSFPRPFSRTLTWGAIVGALSALSLVIADPDVIFRWVRRTAGEGSAVTYWTRVAAVAGQWEQLKANPVAWLVGRGFGHSYQYSQSFASFAMPFLSPDRYAAAMWYPGEFMWMSLLYYGGLLSGTIVIFALCWSALRALRALSGLLYHHVWGRSLLARPMWIGVLGLFAFLGMSFTANPLSKRPSALFLGLTLGLTLISVGSGQISHGNRL